MPADPSRLVRHRRLRRVWQSPALRIMLLAPFFGEALSGSTPPVDLVLPWNLAFMAALYGCGALVCREVAHRWRLGFPGLVLLGVAYGVWEEGFVDRYWFLPSFWHDAGVGHYSVVVHTNVLLAVHLTVFHAAVSICASVLVVEWLTPASRTRSWAGRPGLLVAGAVLALTPVVYGEFDQRPPTPVLVAAAVLLLGAVAAALLIGRRATGGYEAHQPPPTETTGRPRRGLGLIAFACVLAHWVATYSVAASGLPGPAGVGIAAAPVVLGLLVVPRLARTGPWGRDGVRVVAGLLCFFALLDLLVALLGRYDMVLSALLAAGLVWRLHARRGAVGTDAEPGPV